MSNWRNAYRESFFTQFHASVEGTRNWAHSMILNQRDRILFLVSEETGRTIGHCGVCNVSASEAEFDAIIRGERDGNPALMLAAQRVLMRWLLRDLHLKRLHARIFYSNIASMRLFKELGMTVSKVETFDAVIDSATLHYVPTGRLTDGIGKKVAYLELIRSAS
jgi:RimJ/RimL family protein N-acetyltransferase